MCLVYTELLCVKKIDKFYTLCAASQQKSLLSCQSVYMLNINFTSCTTSITRHTYVYVHFFRVLYFIVIVVVVENTHKLKSFSSLSPWHAKPLIGNYTFHSCFRFLYCMSCSENSFWLFWMNKRPENLG